MTQTEVKLWKWAAKVLIVAALVGFLAGKARVMRAEAARDWEERYEAAEWYEREPPNWWERTTLGLER